jgi:hypothetical protein
MKDESVMTKKRPAAPKGDEAMTALHVEIPVEWKEWLRDFARRNDRKLKAEFMRALREYRARAEAQAQKPARCRRGRPHRAPQPPPPDSARLRAIHFAILRCLTGGRVLSTRPLARASGYSYSSHFRATLRKLEDLGLIRHGPEGCGLA